MDFLLEEVDDVFGHLVDPFFPAGGEGLPLAVALREDLLYLLVDLVAGLLEPTLFEVGRAFLRVRSNLFGSLPCLGDSFVAVVLCRCDDLVGFLLGRRNSLKNLWPRHSLSGRGFASGLFGSCESAAVESVGATPGANSRPIFPGSKPPSMGILENKARARLFYKYLSRVYDRINPFVWTEEMRTDALTLLDFSDDPTVLDVGCGTGFATEGLLEHVEEVYAIDQSEHQLEQAYAKFGKRGPVHFHRGDAERLPFATDAFDVVWSSGSIEYWPDPVRTLREFRRVLKPGGQVLVVGPNTPDDPIARRLADAMMLFYDEYEADRMFKTAGFEEVRHAFMGPSYSPEVAITTVARAPE